MTVSTLKMPSVDDFQSSTNNFMTEIHNVHNYAIAGSLILRFVITGFYCIPVFSVIRYCRTTVFCVFTFSTSSFASILPRADRHDSLPNVPISFFMIPQRAHHIRLSVLRLTIFVVRRASIRFLIFCARRLLFPFRLDISHRCRRRRLRRVSELVEHKNLRFFLKSGVAVF